MKILLINQEHALFGGPGGAERSVQSIGEYFARQNHDVTFAFMGRRAYTRGMLDSGIHSVREVNGVKTIMLGRVSRLPTHADMLMSLALMEKPDIIHTNVFHRAPQAWRELGRLGIPMVHTLREYKLLCERNMFDGVRDCGAQCADCSRVSIDAREASRWVDGVVGLSRFTLRRHLEYGFFNQALHKQVIPNSYRPLEVVQPAHPRQPGAKLRVGFLGRLHASKGINLIIDAFEKLDPSEVSLVMAGDLQDPHITNRVTELGQSHDAKYLGFLNPPELFKMIDVLVAPSIWHEPFGRVVIEAMAHGVPVIGTDRGGIPDIVENGETGWIFDPDSPGQLSNIIQQILELEPAALPRMSAACIEAAKAYLPEVVGERYLSFYNDVREAKKRRVPALTEQLRKVYHASIKRDKVHQVLRTRVAPRDSRPLKILIVAGEFPKLSETFVLNHVTGLLDLGQDVRVLHTMVGRPEQAPTDYMRYALHERTFCVRPPEAQDRTIRALTQPMKDARSKLHREMTRSELAQHSSADVLDQGIAELGAAGERFSEMYAVEQIRRHAADVDIVHCHFGHRPRLIFRYIDLGAFSPPVVCSYHGIDMSAHVKKFGLGLYDDYKTRLTKALPISNFFRERMLEMGFEKKDVQVHRVGIDCSKFSFANRYRSAGEPLRIVSVGRLVEKKGFEWGIRGVANALEQRPGLDVEYSVVGEGAEMEKLRLLVEELGLAGKVRLLGAQPHAVVTSIMAASHALLAPSVTGDDGDQEGIPTVTMEAMASGLPILSTFHSGIPEAVVDGYTGFLAPERNAEILGRYIVHLYDNPHLGPLFGRQGRSHVELEFNIARQNKKALDLYKRILSGEED
ncbi:glycosyltransferase [Roseomonas sp. KE0001]|uniref:glycosyltransferase n=1 Tax=Roseomonas sp. KE0001 TaxID=2479201 RepID=UPI0018DF4A0F|nr:glycosyltransferase [Roseomonas sp. KE0001]MBI0436023.1 glycosyltransferase [Roseomonas sp. KE0001]